MKENKYDEQKFFMKYSEMERSKKRVAGSRRVDGITENSTGF